MVYALELSSATSSTTSNPSIKLPSFGSSFLVSSFFDDVVAFLVFAVADFVVDFFAGVFFFAGVVFAAGFSRSFF